MKKVIEKHKKGNKRFTQSQQDPKSFWKINPTGRKAEEKNKVRFGTEMSSNDTWAYNTGSTASLDWVSRPSRPQSSPWFQQSLNHRFQRERLWNCKQLLNRFFELRGANSDEVFHWKLCPPPSAFSSPHKARSLLSLCSLSCIIVGITAKVFSSVFLLQIATTEVLLEHLM